MREPFLAPGNYFSKQRDPEEHFDDGWVVVQRFVDDDGEESVGPCAYLETEKLADDLMCGVTGARTGTEFGRDDWYEA